MSISRDEVRRIARLAHLEFPRVQDDKGAWVEPDALLFDEQSLDRLSVELGQILNHVHELELLDLDGIEPTRHGVELPSRTRKDEPKESLDLERALDAAPARIGSSVAVPKIVE